MTPHRVTEAEILDVLLGDADVAVEARVQAAIRTDLHAAALYARWARTVPAVHEAVEPDRYISRRISARVMASIRSGEAKAPAPDAQAGVVAQVLDWIPRNLAEIQVRRNVLLPLAAAAAVLALVVVSSTLTVRDWTGRLRIGDVSGGVYQIVQGDVQTRTALAQGSRIRLPVELILEPKAFANLTLPGHTAMVAHGPSEFQVASPRQVRQDSGKATYRVARSDRTNPFTVQVPQGAVVDLGTEFDVEVERDKGSVVRVREGRVQVAPRLGAQAVMATAGERVLMSERSAVVEAAAMPPPLPAVSRDKKPARDATAGSTTIPYEPVFSPLPADSPAAGLISPAIVSLTQGKVPAKVNRLPPFTLEKPYLGVLPLTVQGRPAEAVVAADRKLNGQWKLHFDANRNGDLTDDPVFVEGEEYAPGKNFRAATLEDGQVVYLRQPIEIRTSGEAPSAEVRRDRLEYFNYNVYSGLVSIQPDKETTRTVRYEVTLVDTDSDGDFHEEKGAAVVWFPARKDGTQPPVLAVGPFGSPTMAAGYRWTLSRELSGKLLLTGVSVADLLKANPLRAGEPFPRRTVETLDGKTLDLAAPKGGYLLVYVWSTWFSACQRDVPFEFRGLASRFGDRGLRMVGIAVDARKEDVVSYIARHAIDYPQVYNGPNLWEGVTAGLGITEMPVAVLVDDTGTVVGVGQSADALFSFLEKSLPPARKGGS